MPPRKYVPRYRKKRKYAVKRRTARVPRVRFGNNNIGLPSTKMVKLAYFANVQFAPSSGIISNYIYNLSSIFKPCYSATGHQPLGHDQWATLYDNYEVMNAKMTVKFVNNATNAVPHMVGVLVDKDAILSSATMDTLKELQHGRGFATLPANSNASRTITVNYSPKVIYGAKDIVDNHQFKAGMGANPPLQAYGIICMQSVDYLTSATANITAQVHIEYNCRLSSPIELTGS